MINLGIGFGAGRPMTDVFFSYCAEDRERVKLVHDAIEDLGFDVFWDQEVPPGTDWDSWIKAELKRARCAIVFWTSVSIASPNVRQEATIANDEAKLIQILLAPLRAEQFPMGLYTTQAIDLSEWDGAPDHEGWIKLWRELEIKVSPKWVTRRLSSLEAAIKAEQLKRQVAEAREAGLESKFSEEVATHKAVKFERDQAQATADQSATVIEELLEYKRLAEEVLPSTKRQLSDAEAALKQIEAKLASRTPIWLRWIGPIALVVGSIGGFWVGQPDSGLHSKESDRLIVATRKFEDDLLASERQRKSSEMRLSELERENEKLNRDLKTARGIADMNWIDAAVALKTARDKQDADKVEQSPLTK